MSSCTVHDRALWVLRAGVASSCVGEAARMLLYGGPVLSWLWMNGDWSEQAAIRVEHAAAFALLACVPLLAWRKAWPVAAVVATWLLLVMVASTAINTWISWLTPGAYAGRYLAPLALIALSLDPCRDKATRGLLRAGACGTFLCHGIEALLGHPQFVDMVLAGGLRVGIEFGESTARTVLAAFGVVDVLVAGAVLWPLSGRRARVALRVAVAWMAIWGLTTALMRMVHLGWGAWPETLIRVTYAAVPLTLLLLWSRPDEATE